jgi:hypothetical protein
MVDPSSRKIKDRTANVFDVAASHICDAFFLVLQLRLLAPTAEFLSGRAQVNPRQVAEVLRNLVRAGRGVITAFQVIENAVAVTWR